MAVADKAEGLAEAQRRIAACRETRSVSLDLSGLGLRHLPRELMELGWLRKLSLENHPWESESDVIGDGGARALSSLVNLTALNLQHNGIGDDGAEALSSLVNLTALSLEYNDISADGARALSRLVNLRALNLKHNEIGAVGARALSRLVNLTKLNVQGNNIGDEGTQALSRLVNLTELDLQENGIGAEGAQALRRLTNLISLSLSGNGIGAEGARALSGLTKLASLDLSFAYIGDEGAGELVRLTNLTSLALGANGIGTEGIKKIATLVRLTSLKLGGTSIRGTECWDNRITHGCAWELARLLNLTNLDLWSMRIGDEGVRALSGLINLTSLSLGRNEIGTKGTEALSGLVNLTSLDLHDNWIGDEGARALLRLVNLTTLHLRNNRIGVEGARALSGLVNLNTLYLNGNGIGAEGAQALSGLVNLTELDLGSNGVIDLSPLFDLGKLRRLDCSGCRLVQAAPELWDMPSLREVILYETELPGVPREVLSGQAGDSCLERLRAHFKDLKGGQREITDFKLMLLGNGRVGKTQICRRLQGQDFDETVPSTHGVKIGAAPLTALRDPVTLRIWDFGGQDIYHGTHALFLKSRAIFMLVWTPQCENRDDDCGRFIFRNQPLGYWLDFVREFSGEDTPVIVVQNQCDEREQEQPLPAGVEKALEAFSCKDVLRYSAKKNRRRAALDEALAEAVHWVRRKQDVVKIGAGRATVKARLEAMYEEGKKRLSQNEFFTLCEEAAHLSSPPLLLDYLHNIGAVFYRKGLFGDDIILDQAWALDAVYAVFDRESKAFKNIQRFGGRFRRADLAEWIWQEHSVQEQELFLSFMEQCGICFTYRRSDKDIEADYIAPDLLPARDDPSITEQLQQKWDDRCDAESTLPFELLPPGLMRSLICRIGRRAGLAAEYWRDGFYFYDRKTGARALVEQRYTKGWAGEIHIQTQRGQAEALLERLLKLVNDRRVALGARPLARTTVSRAVEEASEPAANEALIIPAPEPSSRKEYYVSYAWGDDSSGEARQRELFVDKLCNKANKKGITIIRDKAAMRYGDRISKFMSRIARGDRIFIVLSDKYLKSAYCMHELFDIRRNCREDDAEFIARK